MHKYGKNNLERDGALASDVDAHETPLARLQSKLDEQPDRPENRCGRGPPSEHDTQCHPYSEAQANGAELNARKVHTVPG